MTTSDRPPLDMLRVQVCSMLLPVLLYLVSFISVAVSGLACVQCVSLDTPSCVHGDMTPTACSGPDVESKYCLKSVGIMVSGNGHVVIRGCSNSLQTNCTSAVLEGDVYKVCHHSCLEDGCNQAVSLLSVGISHMSLAFIVVTADLLVAYLLRLRP